MPADQRKDQQRQKEVGERAGEGVKEFARANPFALGCERHRDAAVWNRAEVDQHAENPPLKQLPADADGDVEEVHAAGTGGQRVTELVRQCREDAEEMENEKGEQQKSPM